MIPSSVVDGSCDYFSFAFTTVKRKEFLWEIQSLHLLLSCFIIHMVSASLAKSLNFLLRLDFKESRGKFKD